jgi:hypothetical protein
MTREQAKYCLTNNLTVEDPNAEDFRTGLVIEIVNAIYCIVSWDDDEGTLTICNMRDLVVQYPKQMEVA